MVATEQNTDDRRSTSTGICGSCGGTMRRFFAIDGVPANSCILLNSPEEARAYPRGDIVLGFCNACGFVANMAFDARLAEYSARYEETQGFSPTFNKFHEGLAHDLIERHDLRGKSVLEIGCGKGEFLALLCSLGSNTGVGFDPGYDPERGVLANIRDVRVVQDFYSEQYAHHTADLVCCKMTLEHIPRTAEFVRLSRHGMRPDGSSILYFQVPNATRILRECAFEDIYYEHCSYFSAGSLGRLFRAEGFDILDIRTEYDDQYLAIEARLAGESVVERRPEEEDLSTLRELVTSFPTRCSKKIESWRNRLQTWRMNGSVVLWGSGSKAVSFLSIVDVDGAVESVVDINPYRQGHYMPGTGQPIVAPEVLGSIRPSAVVIMNAVYFDEIKRSLDEIDLRPEIFTL